MSDRISYGPHPNRPVPPVETGLAIDHELVQNYPELIVAAAEGINDVIGISGREGQFNGDILEQSVALSEIELQFVNERGQVEFSPLLWNLKDAATSESPVFALISKDLVAPGTNFIFGVTSKEWNISIQSIWRFTREIQDKKLLSLVVRHIARHEFAHLKGLDADTVQHQDTRGGIYHGHCANTCSVRQVNSIAETVKLAKQLEHRHNAGFCRDCTNYLSHR